MSIPIVADNVEALLAIKEAVGESLPLARFPRHGEPHTHSEIRASALASDMGLQHSAIGDLLSWAAANPEIAQVLATRLGGATIEAQEVGQPAGEILVLADGSALLWSEVTQIYTVESKVMVRVGRDVWFDVIVDNPEEYRDQLVAEWQKRRS